MTNIVWPRRVPRMVTIEEELTKTELFCDMYPLNRPPKRFLLGFEVIDLGGRFHGDFQSKKFHIPHFEKPEALLFPMIPDVCVCNDVHTISKTKPLLGFGVLTNSLKKLFILSFGLRLAEGVQ